MSTHTYELESSRSRIVVQTHAEGLLSAAAHDLELEGKLSQTSAEGTPSRWSAKAKLSAKDLRVVGALKRGVVDRTVLSPKDQADIEQKMRSEALLNTPELQLEATGDGRSAELSVRGPGGPGKVGKARLSLESMEEKGNEVHVRGRGELELKSFGAVPIKGPLGAFRLADKVQLKFELVFVQKA